MTVADLYPYDKKKARIDALAARAAAGVIANCHFCGDVTGEKDKSGKFKCLICKRENRTLEEE